MKFYHEVSGRRYFSLQDAPEHQTLDGYKNCIRLAYGSLKGVTVGLTADLHPSLQPRSAQHG